MVSNPSETGGGFVVMNELGENLAEEIILKKGFTNNEAELKGVLKATELAGEFDTIVTDSRNTIAWIMSKKRKMKARPDLKEFADKALTNILDKNLELIWEGRETNKAGIYIEFTLQQNFEKAFK